MPLRRHRDTRFRNSAHDDRRRVLRSLSLFLCLFFVLSQTMWNDGLPAVFARLNRSRSAFGKTAQDQINDEDEDLQRCRHYHLAVRFRMLDAPGDRLDKTGGFPDELPSSNPWGDPTRSATQ